MMIEVIERRMQKKKRQHCNRFSCKQCLETPAFINIILANITEQDNPNIHRHIRALSLSLFLSRERTHNLHSVERKPKDRPLLSLVCVQQAHTHTEHKYRMYMHYIYINTKRIHIEFIDTTENSHIFEKRKCIQRNVKRQQM